MRRLTACSGVGGGRLWRVDCHRRAPPKNPPKRLCEDGRQRRQETLDGGIFGKKTDDKKAKAEKQFSKLDKDGDVFSLDEFNAPEEEASNLIRHDVSAGN